MKCLIIPPESILDALDLTQDCRIFSERTAAPEFRFLSCVVGEVVISILAGCAAGLVEVYRALDILFKLACQ